MSFSTRSPFFNLLISVFSEFENFSTVMRNFSGCLILASIYLILSSIFTTSFCKSAMSFFELVFDGFWRFFVEFGILFRQDRLSCLVSAFCGPKARVFRRSGLTLSFSRIRSYHLRMLRNRICCWFCQTLRRVDPWWHAYVYCSLDACRPCYGIDNWGNTCRSVRGF